MRFTPFRQIEAILQRIRPNMTVIKRDKNSIFGHMITTEFDTYRSVPVGESQNVSGDAGAVNP